MMVPYNGEAGGDYVIWSEYHLTCQAIIEKYQLERIKKRFLPERGYPVAQSRIRPWPCGGIKGPHLHYGGDVFLLKADQWMDFTKTIINECQEKLHAAMTVPHTVSSIAMVGEAVANLPVFEEKARSKK